MTLDRFARNELRLAALGKIPKKTRDLWSLGALLDAEGDAPESLTWAADYAAGGENPKLALLGEEGLTPLMLPELTGMPITRMDAGQTLAGAKHTMVQKLLRRRELRGLRALDLCGAPVKAAAAELSGCDRLESLGLGATALVVEGLTRASLPALKGLELRGNKLCAKDLLALLQATGLPLLEELDAGANLVTDDGFDALVGSGALGGSAPWGSIPGPQHGYLPRDGRPSRPRPMSRAYKSSPSVVVAQRTRSEHCSPPSACGGCAPWRSDLPLRRVELPALESFAVNLLDPESIAALLASPAPTGLHTLDLWLGWYDLAALPALYRSPWCSGLRSLTLRCSGFRAAEDASAALDIPALPELQSLALRCPVPTTALAKLRSGGALTSLHIDRLEPGGAEALDQSGLLSGLKELSIETGRTDASEFAGLVSSPKAASLQGLAWGCGAVGPAGLQALLQEASCTRLVALSMQTTAEVDEVLSVGGCACGWPRRAAEERHRAAEQRLSHPSKKPFFQRFKTCTKAPEGARDTVALARGEAGRVQLLPVCTQILKVVRRFFEAGDHPTGGKGAG